MIESSLILYCLLILIFKGCNNNLNSNKEKDQVSIKKHIGAVIFKWSLAVIVWLCTSIIHLCARLGNILIWRTKLSYHFSLGRSQPKSNDILSSWWTDINCIWSKIGHIFIIKVTLGVNNFIMSSLVDSVCYLSWLIIYRS